jgi:hypothetical protein
MRDRRAYPAIALTTDTSLLTAAGNDFGSSRSSSPDPGVGPARGSARRSFDERKLAQRPARRGAARAQEFACWHSPRELEESFARWRTIRLSSPRLGPTARRSSTCIEHLICEFVERGL